MRSWAPPNAPRLSEGLFGVSSGPYPPPPAQLMPSETVPHHNVLQKRVRVRPLLTVIPPCCYNKSSASLTKGVWTRHAPSWGIKHSLPSNIFLLKTHSKDYSHRKFCKHDIFINFVLKKKPNKTETAKETQNKTCWMKTVNSNFFYCLNKEKWHTPSAFLFQIYLTEVKILLYSDSTYNSTAWSIVLFWEVLRLVNWKVWGTLINLTINLLQRNILIHSVYTVNFFLINLLTLTREGYLAIIYYSSFSFSPRISRYFNTNKTSNVCVTEPNSLHFWHIVL